MSRPIAIVTEVARTASAQRSCAVHLLLPSLLLALAASPSLLACGSEPAPPREPAPPAAPVAAPVAPAAPEPEVEPTPEELPVADDFAAEAEQAIDAKSYKAELDALDKELSAESASATP